MPEAFNLNILIRPSRFIVCYFIALHCLSGLALYLWFPRAVVLIVAVLAVHAFWVWRRYLAKLPSRLRLSANSWSWQLEYESVMRVVALESVTAWPWLLVLKFSEQSSAKTITLVVMTDNCQSDDFRRLRIALKTYKAFSG